jgi:hypothetical protein
VELIFWWMPIAWAAVIAVVALLIVRRERRRADVAAASLPVANSERLTRLPGYRRALAKYRALLIGLAASILIVLVASIGLSTRLASLTVTQPDLKNRDIVLCLDVSGSMIDYDTEVLDVFGDLAERFQGERISLVIFNASAVTYFPLTSDYDYIRAQFAELQESFKDKENGDFYRGTLLGDGSSLVGDGLATCAVRFDQVDEPRSRSVILVTDNLIAGDPIFTLPEAGALATERGVRVYGINPGDTEAKAYLDDLAVEFKQVIEGTGGSYFALDDPQGIPSIVDEITAQQAALMRGPTQLVRTDEPGLLVLFGVIGLAGLFLLSWRLKR